MKKTAALPISSLPHDQALKTNQRRFLIPFLILLGFSAFSTYWYAAQQAELHELVPVLVAAADMAAPKILKKGDLEMIQLPRRHVPVTAFGSFAALAGQTLITPIGAGEMLLQSHFQPDLDPDSVSATFAELYAFTIDEDWFAAQLPDLRPGDRIDILATNPKGTLDQTTTVATNLRVLDFPETKKNRVLTLNLTDADAKRILFARGLRLPMHVLVHSSLSASLPTIPALSPETTEPLSVSAPPSSLPVLSPSQPEIFSPPPASDRPSVRRGGFFMRERVDQFQHFSNQ